MNKIITFILLLSLFSTNIGFAQKHNKRDKKKGDTIENPENRQEVTNLFLDATKAKLTGDIPKAIDLFKNCLEKNPDHAASMYELASLFLDQDNTSDAERLCRNAISLEPDNKWYKLLLVDICSKEGNKGGLLEICKQLVQDEPNNIDYLYELANAYILDNDASAAIRTYDKIEQLIGVNEEISLQKQRIFVFQKKFDEAASEIEKLITEFPDQESRYYSMVAEMYMQQGKPDKAVGFYKKILQNDPGNPYIHISLSDYYRQKGDKQQAFEELNEGFANPALDIETKIRVFLSYYISDGKVGEMKDEEYKLTKTLVKTHPEDPKSHSFLAMLLFEDKKYAEAREEFRKTLTIDSSSYSAWESLLNAEIQLGDYASLADESQRAKEMFPLQPIPYFFNGIASFEKKEYAEAVINFNAGVKLVVGNNLLLLQFYTYLGDTYNAMKNYKSSDESYEKALKIDPENSYVLNNYSYYLSLRGENLAKAEAMSSKAMKLNPDNAANLDTFGWVLYKLGRFEEAKQWVEKAITLSPKEDADLLEHLGDIYFKLGDVDKANSNWQNAKKAGGGSPLLEKKIKERILHE